MDTTAARQRIAARIVDGLPTANRVLVRDRCGRAEVVDSIVAAFEPRAVDVIVQHRSDTDVYRLLSGSAASEWTTDRLAADGEFPAVDATVTLGGFGFDPVAAGVDPDVVAAWGAAIHAGIQTMDDHGMTTLVVAIPSAPAASLLGITIEELDAVVFPAVLADLDELQARCQAVAAAVEASASIIVRTDGCRLDLDRARRTVHVDDGVIDIDDQRAGAVVSNLPAGSVYWTVAENATTGAVRLDDGTTLTFDGAGRVASGAYAGERLSHVGIGLNPYLAQPIGWTVIDEHIAGRLFLALGENRYMGGENASSINVDLLVAGSASLHVGSSTVVDAGRLSI